MSVTILGQHIRLIRPEKIRKPIILKKDLPQARYNKRPKTTYVGKVVAICVRLKSGGIRSIIKGTHVDVINAFDIDPLLVVSLGWELEDGNYVWK